MRKAYKVLFVCRAFPPEGGSAVQRPVKFVKFMPKLRWIPYVVTCRDEVPLKDKSLLKDIPENVIVERASTLEPECLKIRIKMRWENISILYFLFNALLKIYSIFYYRIAIPDKSIGWIPFAYSSAANLIKKHNIDLLYIHSQPPSSFILGYLLKHKFKIPLIFDYDDPWTTSQYYSGGNWLKRGISKFLEAKLLKTVDRIIYCKESIGEALIKQFRFLKAEKLVHIPNGYDPSDFLGTTFNKCKNERFRIVYTGKLSEKFCYSPESFLIALKQLRDAKLIKEESIEVVLVGMITSKYLKLIKKLNLINIVKHVGYLDHSTAISYLQSADALLFLIESSEGQKISYEFSGSMPAKIFEYLFSSKPILAIIPPGPEADMLKQSGSNYFAKPNDPNSIKKSLLRLITSVNEDTLLKQNLALIKNYHRKKLTCCLTKEFTKALSESQQYNENPIF